jgi:Mn-dependent DtxR family transcriptional regulator
MTPQNPIDDDLRRFVLASIPSVSYLEAALLFRRQPSRRTADEAARALYISTRGASEILSALCLAGVLSKIGDHFEYAPRDAELASMLERLENAYATHLVAVTSLIHDKTHRNARRFADAFKLRKET